MDRVCFPMLSFLKKIITILNCRFMEIFMFPEMPIMQEISSIF